MGILARTGQVGHAHPWLPMRRGSSSTSRSSRLDARSSKCDPARARMRVYVIGAIATVAGLVAGNARADDAPPSARLQLEVNAPCSDANDFGARIRARSSRLEVGTGEDAIRVAVTVLPSPEGHRVDGTLQVGESVRHVEGATCEEVVEALGLVTVLTFDPEAGAAPVPPPSPPPTAAETPPPPPPSQPPAASPLRPAPPVEGWRWGLGMHGVGATIDEVPIGASVVGEMARGRELSTLTLRLALTTYSANVELGARAANLVWSFLVPQVCPLRFRAGPLSVFPCAGVAMGVLSSEPTRGVARPRSFTRGWVAPRAAVRTRLALAPRLGLELEGALDVPIIRDRYSFGGDVEAYRVPALVPSIGLGIAMELP